ncbi:MAG: phenylalanine--tRNA ligase beta subunit [marine bacterium B5-7]|nr:MAG: phenylalanine--tRNA ligase beta subunit [marine bacterium B5-7]
MKFSEKWLREFVNPDVDTETLMHQLTMAGLEVDGIEPACPAFDGLVVAEVKTVSKHPDADKLQICEVDCGDKASLTIVCGAANVRPGMRTVLAKVGASLPGIDELKPVSLKGVTSSGMLCSAKEIGLGDDHEGIMDLSVDETVGKPLTEVIDSNDNIIEISLTPNRGDCLSIMGIAREVAVFNQIDFSVPEVQKNDITASSTRNVKLSAVTACPKYLGRVIENVDASVKSPLWLSEKLRRSGIRSINIAVDITNFVMLELGQPMHAFDNDVLQGEIEVRLPKSGEKIKLLDESEIDLKSDTLLITDDSGPIAMAGVMGGFESAVSSTTKNIFLESAFFEPKQISGEARQYGLHTDSSHRFERGVDPELQSKAIERATELVLEMCGGQAGPVVEALSVDELPKNKEVILRKPQIKRVLGIELDEQFVTDTFTNLGMRCNYDNNQWYIVASSHRFDINIEVDLIEELARIYSYDAIPVSAPNNKLKMRVPNENQETIKRIREILVNHDYHEVITYSFIDPKLNKLLNHKNNLLLSNPIAPELSEMRTSLLPGLLNTLQYNIKRQQERLRIFETGLVFNNEEDLKQESHVAGLIHGNINEKQWDKDNVSSDFYDLKNDIETFLYASFDVSDIKMETSASNILHPGQAVDVYVKGKNAGCFGRLHPKICVDLDLPDNVYLFEFNIKKILKQKKTHYKTISKFPSVKRDVSVVIDEKILLEDVLRCARNDGTDLLTNLELFDVYQGEGIEKGKKSLALGLTFQATSSTLKDEEVEAIVEKMVDGLNNNFGAKLRE